MNITFILPSFGLNGGNRVVAIYARILQSRGHRVNIIAQPFTRPSVRSGLSALRRGQRIKHPVDGAFLLDGAGVNLHILDTPTPPEDHDLPDADVVIATWWETAFWTAALAPSKGRKFYFVQHHEVHSHLPWRLSRGSYYLPLKKITISQWLVDIMAHEYGDTNVALVPNGVDIDQFYAPDRSKQSQPTVGLMYAPTHFKGLDISLAALAQTQEHIPDLKVVAFGTTPPVSRYPLPKNSTFHLNPAQQNIRDIYASCDAWLFGSRTEGFGLPLLEAMACRTPVVGTCAGAAPELIVDGHNGYLVSIEDSNAMANRLIDVLSMSGCQWRSMSDVAFATARQNTWDVAADRFEQALING